MQISELPGGCIMIFTIEELAEYLKISKEKIYKMLQASELPAFKVGNQWRFKKSDIENWISENTVSVEKNNNEVREAY